MRRRISLDRRESHMVDILLPKDHPWEMATLRIIIHRVIRGFNLLEERRQTLKNARKHRMDLITTCKTSTVNSLLKWKTLTAFWIPQSNSERTSITIIIRVVRYSEMIMHHLRARASKRQWETVTVWVLEKEFINQVLEIYYHHLSRRVSKILITNLDIWWTRTYNRHYVVVLAGSPPEIQKTFFRGDLVMSLLCQIQYRRTKEVKETRRDSRLHRHSLPLSFTKNNHENLENI